MTGTTRRSILTRAGAAAVAMPAFFSARPTAAQLPALPALSSADALLLRPGDAQFANYQASFNARTMLSPQLRAMCKTVKAVTVMIDWCRGNDLPFAIRCGGHSYEGFSQSISVVIDTRMMDAIRVDAKTNTASVGAGASLGALYTAIAPYKLAFTGGSCPTVGVSGHLLGGGYGYLARPFGLACDSLLSVDLVDPDGRPVHADAQDNADLFWACRGGGGGSFGVATAYSVRLQKVPTVIIFRAAWPALSPADAAAAMKAWQAWAPFAPATIDSNLVIAKGANDTVYMHAAGQSVGTLVELRNELKALPKSPSLLMKPMSFIDAVNYFSGGWSYPVQIMKGKSDYAAAPLGDDGLATLVSGIARSSGIYVVCDAYGGAMAKVAPDATAFVHRAGTLFCLQYGSVWTSASDTPKRLEEMRQFYATMRPHLSGAAYVNYCDTDLADWPNAYWGQNLPRLQRIKSTFDPNNVFRHAQSIPLT
jgi:FAD binding domain-containing protein/berberine-like enzyme